jgi:hypothetical protein
MVNYRYTPRKTMNTILWSGGVFGLNLLLGIGFILGVYTFMARRVRLGALGGVGLATGLIYAQATLGERIPGVTVADMKVLIIAAALGATLGVVGTVLVFKLDL